MSLKGFKEIYEEEEKSLQACVGVQTAVTCRVQTKEMSIIILLIEGKLSMTNIRIN
jgi:hypothetical protein